MAESDEIYQQLQKIKESEPFSRSGINIRLLTLLVEASLDGTKLKETTIGNELFGRQYDPVKNDTKVRVYIHNLRKKLATYYEIEGAGDQLLFEIEKGQYQVRFSEKNMDEKKSEKKNLRIWAMVFVIVSAMIVVFQVSQKTPFFWAKYVKSKLPVTVLIGDHFTLTGELATGGGGIFRDFNINSESDFSAYIYSHPEKAASVTPNQYPYITKMGPYCTKTITEYLLSEKIDFNLMLNSEWDKSLIGNENLVYIGQFKTMGFLRNVFFEKNPEFSQSGSGILYTNPKKGESHSFVSHTGDEIIDYTIVSQVNGPNGNTLSFFLSDNDIGVIRLVDYFTNPDSIATFSKKYNLEDKNFTALFKVSGWERTGFKQKLELIELKD